MGEEMPGAKPGPCTAFVSNGERVIFKQGVIGPLTEDQTRRLCTSTEVQKDASGHPNRVFTRTREKLSLMGKINKCCLKTDIDVENYLECVAVEAHRIDDKKGDECVFQAGSKSKFTAKMMPLPSRSDAQAPERRIREASTPDKASKAKVPLTAMNDLKALIDYLDKHPEERDRLIGQTGEK